MALSFEQGPIRPPSEAQSLLLRFTRNCSWNNCLFCPVYKGRRFSRRTVTEVKDDIRVVAEIINEVRAMSSTLGWSGQVTPQVANYYYRQDCSTSFLNVVAWLYFQTGAVFLQDANNLIIKTDDLVAMLEYLFQMIPGITRVTSYARAQTAARKSAEELQAIHAAGLNRIHVGMESGSDQVLKFMKKGVTAAAQIHGGQKIKAAGMELSEYYMPGLGGRIMWREHATESAKVLNQINPDYIRLRTLRIPDRTNLFSEVRDGRFQPQTDDEVVEEIRLFIEQLDGIGSFVGSDHIMNLLQDVEGYLPGDKDLMLQKIDRYLSLNQRDRLHYRVGRRMGVYQGVADMTNSDLFRKVETTLVSLERRSDVENILNDMADKMI
ncbi:MAG: radical SAM protein [Deltaproteobacteria bacterium]|nr:radical SAM protein [Deltaproteobacteria bacterium]